MLLLILILVMLLAVILGKKRYPWTKYIVVLLIVSGVALFLYKDVSVCNSSVDVRVINGMYLGWGWT